MDGRKTKIKSGGEREKIECEVGEDGAEYTLIQICIQTSIYKQCDNKSVLFKCNQNSHSSNKKGTKATQAAM